MSEEERERKEKIVEDEEKNEGTITCDKCNEKVPESEYSRHEKYVCR